MRGAVYFIGAGPGAGDLITMRGARRIAEADVVLHTSSVIDQGWLREHARADAELVDLARLSQDDVTELYRRAVSRRLSVVHLLTGDAAQSPVVREQRDLCEKLGLDAEIVPGVAPASAAAAAVGVALVEQGVAESVVVTEADFAKVAKLAARCATVAVHAPAARAAELAETLVGAGLDADTPVTVAHKVSWSDQTLVRTTLGELATAVKAANLWRASLFLIGDAVREGKPRNGYVRQENTLPTQRWSRGGWKSTRDGDKPASSWASAKAERDRACVDEPEQPIVGKPVPDLVIEPVKPEVKPRQPQAKANAKAPARRTAAAGRANGRKPTKKA